MPRGHNSQKKMDLKKVVDFYLGLSHLYLVSLVQPVEDFFARLKGGDIVHSYMEFLECIHNSRLPILFRPPPRSSHVPPPLGNFRGGQFTIRIGYTPRARLLSELATECCRYEVAKSLGNQARGMQPACTMTTQNSEIRLISSIALKSRLIT